MLIIEIIYGVELQLRKMRTRQQSKLLDNNSASSSKSRNRNKSNDDNITEQSTSTENHYIDVAPQLQLDIVNSDKEPIVTNCLPPTKTPGKHFKKKLIQQHAIEEEKVDPDLCDMSKTNPKRGKRNPKTNYNPPDMEYYKLGTDERGKNFCFPILFIKKKYSCEILDFCFSINFQSQILKIFENSFFQYEVNYY